MKRQWYPKVFKNWEKNTSFELKWAKLTLNLSYKINFINFCCFGFKMFVIRFALLSSFFYALNVSMLPLIYTFEISAFLFLFIRFATTFFTSLIVTKSLFSFSEVKRQKLGIWILILSILFGVQSWLYVEAVKYMSVGLASVVLFTYPLITYLIVSLLKRRSLDLITILMFLVGHKDL